MVEPDISVIILTRNEEAVIARCLEGIFAQKTEHQFEVIVIDSGSTDATVEIASRYDVHISRIKPDDFSHSKTRNLGAKKSRGEFLVFISAHAYPVTDWWMKSLSSNFTNELIAGVYGKQISSLVDNPLIHRQQFTFYNETRRVNKKCDRLLFQTFFFSNANSMIRKKILRIHPFDEDISYAEDLEWATWAILNGYKTVYDPSAVVYHSHNYPLSRILKRSYNDGHSHKKIFREKHKQNAIFKNSLRTFLNTANPMKDVTNQKETHKRIPSIREILWTIMYRAAQSVGYLLGYIS